eukprot:CAMPEP_0177744470 /NCGR_PEP_ID=MMETSP0484_2-20121128/29769_1 /TAXON_ID=354590 /ORGANISM="Rhodomonas lens, Strain RHODO" /LENGTH=49 /DNA_ID= /DNA_START= /DNA_END= /DNA_ORIENTATION=
MRESRPVAGFTAGTHTILCHSSLGSPHSLFSSFNLRTSISTGTLDSVRL